MCLPVVTPPPQMPARWKQHDFRLRVGERGTAAGFSKGSAGAGDHRLRHVDEQPEKASFGHTAELPKKSQHHAGPDQGRYPRGDVLDANDNANRREAVRCCRALSMWVACRKLIANSMTGFFEFEKGDVRPAPDFNVFFRYNATYPFYSDLSGYLTQMRPLGARNRTENKPE